MRQLEAGVPNQRECLSLSVTMKERRFVRAVVTRGTTVFVERKLEVGIDRGIKCTEDKA
jgi:hypothetical protein